MNTSSQDPSQSNTSTLHRASGVLCASATSVALFCAVGCGGRTELFPIALGVAFASAVVAAKTSFTPASTKPKQNGLNSAPRRHP